MEGGRVTGNAFDGNVCMVLLKNRCMHGFVEEHLTHNLAIGHAVADLRIDFAVVD